MSSAIENQSVTSIGVFKEYSNGYFIFELENGDILDFEQINKNILSEFDLKNNQFKNQRFEVVYKEIIDEDDEDFMVFKIDKLVKL